MSDLCPDPQLSLMAEIEGEVETPEFKVLQRWARRSEIVGKEVQQWIDTDCTATPPNLDLHFFDAGELCERDCDICELRRKYSNAVKLHQDFLNETQLVVGDNVDTLQMIDSVKDVFLANRLKDLVITAKAKEREAEAKLEQRDRLRDVKESAMSMASLCQHIYYHITIIKKTLENLCYFGNGTPSSDNAVVSSRPSETLVSQQGKVESEAKALESSRQALPRKPLVPIQANLSSSA